MTASSQSCPWDNCIYPSCNEAMGCPPDARFIGYYTIYGPNGYVEAISKESAERLADQLLEKWPHALKAKTRRVWFWCNVPRNWRITIWARCGLAGN